MTILAGNPTIGPWIKPGLSCVDTGGKTVGTAGEGDGMPAKDEGDGECRTLREAGELTRGGVGCKLKILNASGFGSSSGRSSSEEDVGRFRVIGLGCCEVEVEARDDV